MRSDFLGQIYSRRGQYAPTETCQTEKTDRTKENTSKGPKTMSLFSGLFAFIRDYPASEAAVLALSTRPLRANENQEESKCIAAKLPNKTLGRCRLPAGSASGRAELIPLRQACLTATGGPPYPVVRSPPSSIGPDREGIRTPAAMQLQPSSAAWCPPPSVRTEIQDLHAAVVLTP